MSAVRIGAKTDYALRAALELAAASGDRPVKAETIANAQQIPPRFLEKILNDLRRAGLVESRRGVDGGHLLARPADEITVGDVIRAIDGPLANVAGKRPHELHFEGPAEKLPAVLVVARAALRDVLDRTTLAEIAAGELPPAVAAIANDPDVWAKRG
jgi:Rrf2 family protein